MKRRQILITGLLLLAPNPVVASLGNSFPERDVSGKVVDVDKRRGFIVLAEYKGWDREQMNLARAGAKAAMQRRLDRVGPKNAALFLKREDMAKLKKGDHIRIAKYSYALASYGNGAGADVAPIYEKLEVSPK